jgi:hypothetical protein
MEMADPDDPDDPARLAAEFTRSHYQVRALGRAGALRVGREATALQAAWPAQRYALITAWESDRAPRTANEHADGVLVAELDRLGVERLRTWAEDDQGGHHEEGWLVRDLPLEALDRLARRFHQSGVLAWDADKAVRLRLYRAAPDPTAARMPFVDWVGRARW